MSALSAADHVTLVQSLFVLHEFDVDDLKKLSEGRREAFGSKILELMTKTDLAKAKGLTDIAQLKKALEPTKKDKDVKVGTLDLFGVPLTPD